MTLIGHSINALIALAYAAKYSHRIDHLILIGSSPYSVGPRLIKEADDYFKTHASFER